MSYSKTAENRTGSWEWIQFILDAFCWFLAMGLALVLRYELHVEWAQFPGLLAVTGIAAAAQLIFGYLLSIYRGRYQSGSFGEVQALLIVTLIVAAVTTLILMVGYRQFDVGRSVALIAAPIACIGMAGIRYLRRLYREAKSRPGDSARNTLIYGAGFVGNSLVARMIQDQDSPYYPVGLIDDDPGKKHLRLSGVQVLGRGEDIRSIVHRTKAEVLVLAFANVDSELVTRVSDSVSGLNVRVLVLPPLNKMLSSEAPQGFSDFRDISVEDLIGRRPVDIQVEKIAGYISGRRVIVTGAGGSIGSELCRQISQFGPAELIMLDHDETALQHTQITLTGHGLLNGQDTVLCSIRDQAGLDAIFQARRPEVVFHAAALKHAPLLQQYPAEGWKTNVLGSLNVLRAARAVGVSRFVNISTDKAANPSTALGHSKRMAERLTAWMARETERPYVSVRFGNVMGSRGSMLPLFTEQIRVGGPVTVTHRDVTRFFMTIPEACQLVIQAGAIGQGGEVMLLDMGQPVRILDVAQRMIAMSGRDVEIVFTGLRPGEKMHEELIGDGEINATRIHPKISQALTQPLDPAELDLAEWLEACRLDEEKLGTSGIADEESEDPVDLGRVGS
ncbi:MULTISPECIES: nucleoside-diphosphate sugar epimerase/dehydratase [Arthrobacter]|uniref:Nucleoside-diphosphate sugar epimerase/dehydratase n=2 Tax=Arthrobacter TaxID=1663 RepID=A0ABU9KSI4_9MICC|nr:nucleoside-diphosphate sugar epimerase/dehydratase [Arthrobacter sp. YJM1]MDP5228395.1 nucleoside-diphosphate sugar epimerase/dehydratase [Arthrobacter sp. YJM1]